MSRWNRNREPEGQAFNDNQYRTQRDAVQHMSTEALLKLDPQSPEGQRAVREELESREGGQA